MESNKQSVTPINDYKNICQVVQALVEQDRQLRYNENTNYRRRRNAAILSDGKQMAIYQQQRKICLQKQNKYRTYADDNRKWKQFISRFSSLLIFLYCYVISCLRMKLNSV